VTWKREERPGSELHNIAMFHTFLRWAVKHGHLAADRKLGGRQERLRENQAPGLKSRTVAGVSDFRERGWLAKIVRPS
jgi:hypothetical protein